MLFGTLCARRAFGTYWGLAGEVAGDAALAALALCLLLALSGGLTSFLPVGGHYDRFVVLYLRLAC